MSEEDEDSEVKQAIGIFSSIRLSKLSSIHLFREKVRERHEDSSSCQGACAR